MNVSKAIATVEIVDADVADVIAAVEIGSDVVTTVEIVDTNVSSVIATIEVVEVCVG